jgi:hypothetical protein
MGQPAPFTVPIPIGDPLVADQEYPRNIPEQSL